MSKKIELCPISRSARGCHQRTGSCPAIPGAKIGNREWGILAAVITAIDRIYNVDRDRVLLTGHSWGGIVTWRLGPLYADRFAGLAPFVCAVNPGENHLRNLKNVPVYSVQGKRDMKWMLDTGRERIEILKKLRYEHVYRELSGGHEAFPVEITKIVEWFGQRPRNLYAPEIVRTRPPRTRAAPRQWYWLRTESPAFRTRIDGNTIDVDCDGAFEVLLADEMVDLDKPVKIVRDEETLFEGKVERSLGFALDHVRKSVDRARVFAASVAIE